MIKFANILFFVLAFSLVYGHSHDHNLKFEQNKGQWGENILFKTNIVSGKAYFEKNCVTYNLLKAEDLAHLHDVRHGYFPNENLNDVLIRGHAFKTFFLNANPNPVTIGSEKFEDYVNYFLGNDESKWAGGVEQYAEIKYQNIYPGIDLVYYSSQNSLKYDYVVKPLANAFAINMLYEGVDKLSISKRNLVIKTSIGDIVELKPYAYQLIDGVEKEVKCKFQIKGNSVSFSFPKGYDQNLELIIDPQLIFSSFTGATSDNWGFTATYDNAGNTYAGGIVFGTGYPKTTGAYQTTFGGGTIDIGITKFNTQGNGLIYSTLLGGNSADSPHSLVVNQSTDELYVLGTTSSNNFPTTVGCFDNTFNGGVNITTTGTTVNYPNGSDIFVTKFSAAGNTLIGSTYIGGSGNDGLNISPQTEYNYGDSYRGEIIVDNTGDCYISSCTFSTNFPTVLPFQAASGGNLDGCVFKLSSNLNTLVFSSYIGGSGNDAAYSVERDNAGNVFIAGGTASNNFPTTPGAHKTTLTGGTDGFVSKIHLSGSVLLASTYNGTSSYDQNFFVQLDNNDDAFVVGQTRGTYPIVPGPTTKIYSNPNSGQFIQKFNNNLTTSLLSTSIGRSSNNVDISISAFLVNQCDQIYISGWGGTVNSQYSQATSSTTTGLPTTPGAHQTSTNGSDFYLMVLGQDCDTLLYGTFFGSTNGAEHVDGGTSRFDKKGIVYQAVCGGCGTSNLTGSTGSYAVSKGSSNCNLYAIKFDLSQLTADIGFTASPYYCSPSTITFTNTSNGGTNYFWNFGDGNTSTLFQPTHTYTNPGTYQVSLIVSDSLSCVKTDTAYMSIHVVAPPVAVANPVNAICPGDSVQLNASGGTTYQWIPSTGLSNPNIPNPKASPAASTTYQVIVTDSCGADTTQLNVVVHTDGTTVSSDTTICRGQSVTLSASGGVSYSWAPSTYLNNPNISNPQSTPFNSITYVVSITDANGCTWVKNIKITVDTLLPIPIVSNDTTICPLTSAQLSVSGGNIYQWSPPGSLDNPFSATPIASPTSSTTYVVAATNGCGTRYDSVVVTVRNMNISVPDTLWVCKNIPFEMYASGNAVKSYLWSPSSYLDDATISNPTATIDKDVNFNVQITDSFGCVWNATVVAKLYPPLFVDVGPDQIIDYRSNIQLFATSNTDSILWTPGSFLSCIRCINPKANPKETTTYYVWVFDKNGCYVYDTITIYINTDLYVPNTFTPDEDGKNEFFAPVSEEVGEFEMWIFNRWGEEIFYTDNITIGWDGRYKGNMAKTDTYVWKIRYTDLIGKEFFRYGHVNLLK